MTWNERLRSVFNLFKNIALPLYIWYLIYMVLFGIMMIVFSLIPPVENFMQYVQDLEENGLYNSAQVIPEEGLVKHLPILIIIIVFLVGLGLIMTSLLYTGIYHLVVKGFKGRVLFSDFSLTDAKRMIGWNSLVLILFIALFGLGILLFASSSMVNATITFAFTVLLSILGVMFTIFLIPWILTGGYYVLAYRELPFGKALRQSWQFFRKNMATLWGAALAMFIINIFIVLIQEISSSIGGMISFIATPFFTLIPIVWTLTLISEQERLAYLETRQDTLESLPPIKSTDSNLEKDIRYPSNTREKDSSSNHSDCQYSDNLSSTSSADDHSSVDDTLYTDFPYHNEIETVKSLPHYKPRIEDSPPGYYHTSDDSRKNTYININYCPTCGSKLRSNAAYCSKCGIKIR